MEPRSLGNSSRPRGLWAEGAEETEGAEHLRQHRDGRSPGRHAAVLPREALAELMDGALGHAVADHPWEMERKQFSEHWPPLACPKTTTQGPEEAGKKGRMGIYGESVEGT